MRTDDSDEVNEDAKWGSLAQGIEGSYHSSAQARARNTADVPEYESLWKWSTKKPEDFWREVVGGRGVIGTRASACGDEDKMPGRSGFPTPDKWLRRNCSSVDTLATARDGLGLGEDK